MIGLVRFTRPLRHQLSVSVWVTRWGVSTDPGTPGLPHTWAVRCARSAHVTLTRRFSDITDRQKGHNDPTKLRESEPPKAGNHGSPTTGDSDDSNPKENVSKSKFDELGKLVYVAPLESVVRAVKGFSLFTSCAALSLQPMVISRLVDAQGLSVGGGLAVGSAFAFFILATPALIHFVTRKYVTRMYLDDATDRFTACTVSLFLREKRHVFTPADVTLPRGYFATFTTILADRRPLFLDPQFFTSRTAYVRMMRYDEPIDLTRSRDT